MPKQYRFHFDNRSVEASGDDVAAALASILKGNGGGLKTSDGWLKGYDEISEVPKVSLHGAPQEVGVEFDPLDYLGWYPNINKGRYNP